MQPDKNCLVQAMHYSAAAHRDAYKNTLSRRYNNKNNNNNTNISNGSSSIDVVGKR